MTLRIAILDDYQNAALGAADWASLAGCTVSVLDRHLDPAGAALDGPLGGEVGAPGDHVHLEGQADARDLGAEATEAEEAERREAGQGALCQGGPPLDPMHSFSLS